jgi:hypothetical protein
VICFSQLQRSTGRRRPASAPASCCGAQRGAFSARSRAMPAANVSAGPGEGHGRRRSNRGVGGSAASGRRGPGGGSGQGVGSGRLVDELELPGWGVGQGLGRLSALADARQEPPCLPVVGQEGHEPQAAAAEFTEERVDLVHQPDQLRPGQAPTTRGGRFGRRRLGVPAESRQIELPRRRCAALSPPTGLRNGAGQPGVAT